MGSERRDMVHRNEASWSDYPSAHTGGPIRTLQVQLHTRASTQDGEAEDVWWVLQIRGTPWPKEQLLAEIRTAAASAGVRLEGDDLVVAHRLTSGYVEDLVHTVLVNIPSAVVAHLVVDGLKSLFSRAAGPPDGSPIRAVDKTAAVAAAKRHLADMVDGPGEDSISGGDAYMSAVGDKWIVELRHLSSKRRYELEVLRSAAAGAELSVTCIRRFKE